METLERTLNEIFKDGNIKYNINIIYKPYTMIYGYKIGATNTTPNLVLNLIQDFLRAQKIEVKEIVVHG